jgi:hypothetical protein
LRPGFGHVPECASTPSVPRSPRCCPFPFTPLLGSGPEVVAPSKAEGPTLF